LSVPFYGAAVQTGTISSLSGTNSLSVSNASWTANQYAYTTGTTPYYLLLNSGSNTGRYFLITSNSTSQLTVNTNGYSFVTGAPTNSSQIQVQVNDSVGIVPANTLSGVFGTGASCVLATGPSASSADNVILWNGATWNTYYNNGTNWKQSGSLLNQDYAPTAPDAGVFIVRTATTSVNLVVGGTVPTTAARSDLPGQGYSFFINRFPLDTTLSALGLQAMSNWQSGSSASSADNVFLWIGSTWASFYYNGTNWKQAGSLLTFDTQAVPAGSALLIWRQSSAAGSAATLVQTLPYSF
jgi:uncharacterized protein (TIGR02597 family)